ncbi:MAG: hypothetical protein RLZZ01_897 [Actinomycetota bacterium]|jgi:periplasmic divalent cation tolerance protein
MVAEDFLRPSEIVEVVTSCDDEPVLERIAAALIHDHLAACVHLVGPTSSTYRWQGAVHRATEWQLVAVTTRERVGAVVSCIEGAHPYELPSVSVRSVEATDSYATWVAGETAPRR